MLELYRVSQKLRLGFYFQNQNVNLRERFEDKDIKNFFAFHNLYRILGQVLLFIISINIIIWRVICWTINFLNAPIFQQYCLTYRHLLVWNCKTRVQYLSFHISPRKVLYVSNRQVLIPLHDWHFKDTGVNKRQYYQMEKQEFTYKTRHK